MEYEIQMLRKELTRDQAATIDSLLDKNKKSMVISYIMLIFLWWCQAHKIYLKKYFQAAFSYFNMFIFLVSSFFTGGVFSFLKIASAAIFIIFNLKDIGMIPTYVKNYNLELERKLVLKALGRPIEKEPVVGLSKGRVKVSEDAHIPEVKSLEKEISDSVSISLNRLFVLKGRIKNQALKNELDMFYPTLVKVKEKIDAGDIKGADISNLHSYYLPELLTLLEKFDSLEKEDFREETTKKTLTEILDLVRKIQHNMVNILENVKIDKHNDLSVDIKTMKKVMEIDNDK